MHLQMIDKLVEYNQTREKNVMHDMIIIIMYGWIPNVVA